MEKLNAIVVEGKVYEAKPEIKQTSCEGCELRTSDISCSFSDVCYDWRCIFRYSQTLTDKLNRV